MQIVIDVAGLVLTVVVLQVLMVQARYVGLYEHGLALMYDDVCSYALFCYVWT